MPFAIPLSKHGGPLFRQIYLGLREAILSGIFAGGQKLPSTREMADELKVSRTVVLLAYEQLLAEGFAVGRAGSGTYVARTIHPAITRQPERTAEFKLSRFGATAAREWNRMNFPPRSRALPYDFAYGRSDLEMFPFEMWRRLLLRHSRRAPVSEFDYGRAEGNPALREAISAHLRRSRAVNCDASQVLIVNGSQQALDLIARVLIEPGDTVAVEDPCYQGTQAILCAARAHLYTVPVDHNGMDTSGLPTQARAVFVTPSHQFPTGTILPLSRRLELLWWAEKTNAIVVEDDYDGEFRYDGQPLESLQGLDRDGRVVYIGTFSRTVFSSLRIGYLVVPKSLIPAFTAAKWLSDRHTPTLEQETLAEFISSGMYERYLRRVRQKTAMRRRVLLESIRTHLRDRVEITGDSAGAHIVLWPKKRRPEKEIVAEAATRGVGIYGIARYHFNSSRGTGIMLGYSRMTERGIREGIRRLAEVI